MLLLMNSTKTMNFDAAEGKRPRATRPRLIRQATELTGMLRGLGSGRLKQLLGLNDRQFQQARADLAGWGKSGSTSLPSVFAFTGLLYRSVAPASFEPSTWTRARKHLRILSGLYGILRPLDLVEAYRLEMGCRLAGDHGPNLVSFWKEPLTEALNRDLEMNEPILSVAALEYVKALDPARLKGPLLQPAFREVRPDGSLKNATVHAKKARGALIRYALTTDARTPADLLGFDFEGWEAAEKPPESGRWLFTRPAR